MFPSFLYLNKLSKTITLLLVFTLCLTLTACPDKNQSSSDQSSQQSQQQGLSILGDIEKKNEQIIQALNGPASMEEKEGEPSQQQSEQSESKQSQGNQSSGQSSQQGGQSKGQSSQQGGQSQGQSSQQGQQNQQIQQLGQPVSEEQWTTIDQSVVELHTLFNDYMPLAMKQGASSDLTNNANNALNNLTNKVESRSKIDSLFAANTLYKYLCEFYALQHEKSASSKQIIYNVRNVILSAMVSDWSSANDSMTKLKNSWQNQKPTFDEKQKDPVSKLDLSISGLDKVVSQQNSKLVEIKGKIIIKNVSDLEKSVKKAEQSSKSESK